MFDSRWGDDPRDRDDNSRDLSRGSRGGSDHRDHSVVTLTKEGRDLLESRRLDDDSRDRQAFYAGVPSSPW